MPRHESAPRHARRTPLAWIGLTLALALTLAPTAAMAGSEPIVISDLLKLRTANQIDVSADGSQAVYVVRSMVAVEGESGASGHRYEQHLWLADTTGDVPPRQLTFGERRDTSPAFSPHGEHIAFVRQVDDLPQIWILPLSGGEAFQRTHSEHGATSPTWSPNGETIAFQSEIPIDEIQPDEGASALPWAYERAGRSFRDTPSTPGDGDGEHDDEPTPGSPDGDLASLQAWLAHNAREEDPRVLARLDFQDEHSLASPLTFTHIFAIPATPDTAPAGNRHEAPGDAARQLTHGFQDFSNPAWHPDGSALLVDSAPNPVHPDRVIDGDLWRVAIDGSGAHPLVDWPDWNAFAAVPSPDGKMIAFLASDQNDPTYSLTHLALAKADGSQPRRLAAELDRSIDSAPVWSADGRSIYVTIRDRGAFPLVRVDVVRGTIERVIEDAVGVRDFDLAAGRIVYALTAAASPFELYAARATDMDARRLGALNADWLATKHIVTPEEHWIERDGKQIQYWVMRPPAAGGGKIPTVLEIHGGPSAMWGPGEFTMWHEFQVLAARGFGVVYSNPRGSSGYGYGFRRANYRDWGHGPAGDILAALDAAAAQHDWIDREQLVVTGGSYAGYMTAWIVSQDQRFQAAVAQRGVYELSFFFGEGNAWRLVPYHFGGYPWEAEARRFLDANSPQSFVEQIRTPLLIMHADNDLRTGVNQSETLVKSLKVLGRPVEYVRYPDEGHDLSRTGNPYRRMDRMGRIVEFFERFIDHPAAASALPVP